MDGGKHGGHGWPARRSGAKVRSDASDASKARRRRSAGALIDVVFPTDVEPVDVPPELESDLHDLLAGAIRQLCEHTGATRAVAWVDTGDGRIHARAARLDGDAPEPPPRESFEALCSQGRATDLGEPGLPASLPRLAERTGFSAAVAITRGDPHDAPHPSILLTLGGPHDPPGAVRPRTLARLQEVADRLRGPLATRYTLSRLGDLDQAVQHLDRLAALGDLVAEVVHEVRNPLVSVKTFLQLLPDRLDDPEFHGEFRQIVCDEVTRLERLIDSVLTHAAPFDRSEATESGGVEEAFEALAQLVGHRARERQIALLHHVALPGCRVALGSDGLRQVLLNLVINALDATPNGGRVTLLAGAGHPSGWLEITVEDGGPGVAPEDRQRIFEAFHSSRRDRPGGLGLAISRRLVEEAGGTIEVGASADGGARFCVRLALAED
jgi:signal transduction histidine kinase